jgi:hypothetical protein
MSVPHISSYLDEYPEADPNALVENPVPGLTFTGMFLRGNFSLHRSPGTDLAQAVREFPPAERSTLAAYLNVDDVQQRRAPTPSDVVFDTWEVLDQAGLADGSAEEQEQFLRDHHQEAFRQLTTQNPATPDEPPIYEQRRALSPGKDNDVHKLYWWMFGRPRTELRAAWQGLSAVVAFGTTMKIWSPMVLLKTDPTTGLRICPMHNLIISPVDSMAWFGVVSSLLFEMTARRQCSTLKSDLRFTPTQVFPYFPMPWSPRIDPETHQITMFPVPEHEPAIERIKECAEQLLAWRGALLTEPEKHGLDGVPSNWGPTELYNRYDDPDDERPAIEQLRQHHANLLVAVLSSYGWPEAAEVEREAWGFERPWIDRTVRFVPPESVRRRLVERLDALNHERYEEERRLLTEFVVARLPEGGIKQSDLKNAPPFSAMNVPTALLVELLEEEQKRTTRRVKKLGHRWSRIGGAGG